MGDKTDKFRIVSQNVSIFGPTRNFQKLYTHRMVLKELNADVYLFSETSSNAHLPKLVAQIKTTIKLKFGNYSLELSSCINKSSSKHQPGGLFSIFRDKAKSSSHTILKDGLGRWIISKLILKNQLQSI